MLCIYTIKAKDSLYLFRQCSCVREKNNMKNDVPQHNLTIAQLFVDRARALVTHTLMHSHKLE